MTSASRDRIPSRFGHALLRPEAPEGIPPARRRTLPRLPEVLPAVEVGWRLHPSYWGRGLATEGARATLRYGFDVVGLDRIISIYMPENVASGPVMTKLGMHDCLTTKDPTLGHVVTVREITAGEWRADTGVR